MSKSIINVPAFRADLQAYAQKGQLFLNTAREAAETAPKGALRKDGSPTKALLDHVQDLRSILMEKGEDTPRGDWEAAGMPDGSYRGYVTHMANAVIGIKVSGDAAPEMSFKALAAAGKAAVSGAPKAKGENAMDEFVKQAQALLATAPRKGASKFEAKSAQFFADFVAEYAPEGE